MVIAGHRPLLSTSYARSPAASLGIREGDAHVIRNAGGTA